MAHFRDSVCSNPTSGTRRHRDARVDQLVEAVDSKSMATLKRQSRFDSEHGHKWRRKFVIMSL